MEVDARRSPGARFPLFGRGREWPRYIRNLGAPEPPGTKGGHRFTGGHEATLEERMTALGVMDELKSSFELAASTGSES